MHDETMSFDQEENVCADWMYADMRDVDVFLIISSSWLFLLAINVLKDVMMMLMMNRSNERNLDHIIDYLYS